jgi:hypothetical protein
MRLDKRQLELIGERLDFFQKSGGQECPRSNLNKSA